ncbi:MAG TPA: Calx-beta domain-containing protein [Thermoanaerobaculia bacterium]|jgi:uncharacterized repeat protein (TIGR01451 family)|nr:Calx-beta domain-containing protein [Thermoanaerobaculia bacterium]
MRNQLAVLAFFAAVFTAATVEAQSADLVISKSGAESASAGDTIAYSIFVFNNGPDNASNATMSDPLPAGTTFVSLDSSDPTFTCSTPAVGSAGTVTCTAATMPVEGTVRFILSVKTSSAAPSGSITNTATITSPTPDPDTSDNSSSASTGIAGSSAASADLAIDSMERALSASAGSTASFQVVISNKGPSTANHPTLTNAVPANTTFLSASVADPIGDFHCTPPAVGATGNIVCTAPKFDVRGGDQPVFTFTFRVNNVVSQETTLSNSASITADETDPNTSNNTATRTTAITTAPPSADVSVAVSGGGTSFAIVVRNAGPNDAASVTLTDAVPSGSTFVSWSQNSGPAFNCSTPAPGATGTINCSIGILPGFEGKTTTAEFVLTVDTAAQVTNTASVSSSTSDPRPDNNTSSFPVLTRISINDVSVTEGNSGTTPAIFNVTLQPASPTLTVTVDYQPVSGTATSGVDFLATSGTLTFLAGETTKTISVPVIGDTIVEGNETFSVQLSNAINATFQDTSGAGTIIDDDLGGPPTPSVQIGNLTFAEGNSGTFNVTFTATLSAPSTSVSRVRWQTQDGSATAGSDYLAGSGELVFQPGDVIKTFTVAVNGDTTFEPDETFNIVITGTDNTATPPGQAAVGTIVNDDVRPPARHRAAGH